MSPVEALLRNVRRCRLETDACGRREGEPKSGSTARGEYRSRGTLADHLV